MPDDHQLEIEREILVLQQHADHLERHGKRELANECRRELLALIVAASQRSAEPGDANDRTGEDLERLGLLWTTISASGSFSSFLEENDDPEVVQLRADLGQRQTRILMLEAARS